MSQSNQPDNEISVKQLEILLVEDNRVNQAVAVAMLKRMGLSPDVADNGLQAIDKVKSKLYDLILMDLRMPQMDGIEAAARIRSLEEAGRADVPIVALTADAMPEVRDRCFAVGMNDVLVKPVRFETLSKAISPFLAQE
jgi:CheY-like chemotaxis protein